MHRFTNIREILRDMVHLLTFRISRERLLSFGDRHLLIGLLFTWIVGIGRRWDDPGATLLQHLGVGSVIYIFVLAFILWLVVRPFSPPDWSYKHVLTFVSLTSPPAILYAIPVERFTELSTAQMLNVWFLAAVALWRVALLFFYLRRFGRLRIIAVTSAALLPLMAIVATLTVLNLERAVFDIMGGLRQPGTASDGAYAILFLLTFLSIYLVIPVFGVYIAVIAFGGIRKANGPDGSQMLDS